MHKKLTAQNMLISVSILSQFEQTSVTWENNHFCFFFFLRLGLAWSGSWK